MKPASRLPRVEPVLWVLLGLFCTRVLGQVLVAFFDVTFLPPMEQWFSGLLAYPYLLTSQILIIGLLIKVCTDLSRGTGFFARSRPLFAQGALYFGYVYLAAMVLRYIARMSLYPEERWFGGAIPIVFHWVLASYVILFGRAHRARLRSSS